MPKLPPELMRLAEEVIARLGRPDPSRIGGALEMGPVPAEEALGAGLPNVIQRVTERPAPGEVPDLPNQAYMAMQRIFDRVFGMKSPSLFVNPTNTARPAKTPDWLEGKSGLNVGVDRQLSSEDLGNKIGELFLKEATRNPQKNVKQIENAVSGPVLRWSETASENVPAPRDVIQTRRELRKAGTYWGKNPNDPALQAAAERLKAKGLLAPSQYIPVEDVEGAAGSVPSPDEVLASQSAGESPESKALVRLRELVRNSDLLTKPQKDALLLRYGGDSELTNVGLAKALDINENAAKARTEGGIKKLKAALTKEGITPQESTKEVPVEETPVDRLARLRGKQPAPEFTLGGPPPKELQIPAATKGDAIKERIQELMAQREAQFSNSPGTKLVPDPNGDVVINGDRYRRVNIKETYPEKNKRGVKGRVLKEAP